MQVRNKVDLLPLSCKDGSVCFECLIIAAYENLKCLRLIFYRSPTASISSETSSLITAVGLETRKHLDTSTPDSSKHVDHDFKSLPSSKHETLTQNEC